ncbi:MAG: hypothetical protein AAF360_16915 [Pseudomonadota bacterium]
MNTSSSRTPSRDDLRFKNLFEAGEIAPSEFHHREHLRLAYVYLCDGDTKSAIARMDRALKSFLRRNNAPPEKFHVTLTYSWVQAVRHFMERAGAAASFDVFIGADDRLLDTGVMLTHYDRATLFSDRARAEFVEPDIQAIPLYDQGPYRAA